MEPKLETRAIRIAPYSRSCKARVVRVRAARTVQSREKRGTLSHTRRCFGNRFWESASPRIQSGESALERRRGGVGRSRPFSCPFGKMQQQNRPVPRRRSADRLQNSRTAGGARRAEYCVPGALPFEYITPRARRKRDGDFGRRDARAASARPLPHPAAMPTAKPGAPPPPPFWGPVTANYDWCVAAVRDLSFDAPRLASRPDDLMDAFRPPPPPPPSGARKTTPGRRTSPRCSTRSPPSRP
jgi:hypothetical protein